MSKYSFLVSFAIHFQIVSGFPKGCFKRGNPKIIPFGHRECCSGHRNCHGTKPEISAIAQDPNLIRIRWSGFDYPDWMIQIRWSGFSLFILSIILMVIKLVPEMGLTMDIFNFVTFSVNSTLNEFTPLLAKSVFWFHPVSEKSIFLANRLRYRKIKGTVGFLTKFGVR